MSLPYRLIDADNHYYESVDCFTRHIEAKHRDRTLRAERRDDGDFDVFLDGQPWHYMDVKFEKTNKAGSMLEILHRKGDVSWKDSYSKENMLPGFQNRDARIALMDEQGIEAALLLRESIALRSLRAIASLNRRPDDHAANSNAP